MDTSSLVIEMQRQVDSLLEEWATELWKSYKANGNELSIAIKLRLVEGYDTNIRVQSGIAFTVQKITDDREVKIG